MKDLRLARLAKNLVEYSTEVKKGDRVLIENIGLEKEFVCELVKAVQNVDAQPFVQIKDPTVQRVLMLGLTEEQAEKTCEFESQTMNNMQAYIGVRSGSNGYESSDVPSDKQSLYMRKVWHPVHGQIRVPKTRWVVLRFPTPSMAQQASMSTEAFEDYYFDVCCMDYSKMSGAMDALTERMQRTDKVHIIGNGTDITFSIAGLPAIKCDGKCNIPDGEVFTAPVKGSVSGKITYNTPSVYQGFTFENICLTFEDGKIIAATANDTARINQVLDTDEGARFVGEFAIGVNPYITSAMKDTLFDEKIAGSFHFTPGNAYDDCDNGNKSAIHWDLVCIQTPEYGGGEIWFDDKLVRKDGIFTDKDLEAAFSAENLRRS